MIEINNPIDCCGCTACASICAHKAIQMNADDEGFLYPEVDKALCVDCGLCNKVCPIIHRKEMTLEPNQISYKALRIKDHDKLMASSSGGAFVAVAEHIIKKGGVVYGAIYDNNCVVMHQSADTLEGIRQFMGSKYSQSDMRGIYASVKDTLRQGREVLFTGTPCQVEGLRLFLRKAYDNLTTLDLVCHAVPSPKLFKEYVDYCSQRLGSKVVAIEMRHKQTCGWSHRYAYRFSFENGKHTVDPKQIENWGRLFFSKLIDRPSCHECKFTNYHRAGDLTIADFWDDAHRRPDIHSNDGTSLCLVNTPKGQQILNEIDDQIELFDITKKESEQPCLLGPTPVSPRRAEFWSFYQQHGFERSYKKFFTDSTYVRTKKLVKKIIKAVIFYGKKN